MKDAVILFVCTGNTCRSPMAEVYFRSLCVESSIRGLSVKSAGTNAFLGEGASEMASLVLKGEGLSVDKFQSSPLSPSMVETASMIIAMTKTHLLQIRRLFPRSVDKTYLLMNFLGVDDDVFDPFGGHEKDFRRCLSRMKPALKALFEHVRVNLA